MLIYVSAKQTAFNEFYRVLKSGGRLSIFEPINRFHSPPPPHIFAGYDLNPITELALKVKAVYERIQPYETDPMLDFDERDLVNFAECAGFSEVHLELRIDIKPHTARNWDTWAQTSGNPKIPTIAETIDEALTPAEAEQFVAHLQPLVEQGMGVSKFAVAYLWAVKP